VFFQTIKVRQVKRLTEWVFVINYRLMINPEVLMLDKMEALRYDRQIMISHLGKGTGKIKKAGSDCRGRRMGSAAVLSSRCRCRRARIVDKDEVDLSNLNARSHWTPDLDRPR
jgi:molybdopterin/thiamine biosynthesis adenylyltransferase